MDIQISNTPPKNTRNQDDYSTPPKKTVKIEESYHLRTPKRDMYCTPTKLDLTPVKGQNPESKLAKTIGTKDKRNESSGRVVSEFVLSRLDMDYIYERMIGQGNFSQVGLYRSRMSGDLFAIKVTKASSMSVNEAQALGTLSIFNKKSKNIVRYYHSWVEENELYLVMEYCTHDLASIFRKHHQEERKIEEREIKDYLRQALEGLKSMHENKMVHLDIKPDNLLFKESVLKISDLGLTRVSKLRGDSDLDEGDSRYLAKEMLNYYPGIDATKADIFSLAMTIYEGLTLEQLPNNGEEWQNIRNNGLFLKERMDLQNYSQQLLQIVEKMSSPFWSERPSAAEILRMNYFREAGKRTRHHNMLNREKDRKRENSL